MPSAQEKAFDAWFDDRGGTDAKYYYLDNNPNNWKGSDKAEAVFAKGGDDTIFSFDGNDSLFGNDGNDHLYGGDGRDCLEGGNQSDDLYGGDGNDLLVGNEDHSPSQSVSFSGYDYLQGSRGNDLLLAGWPDDPSGTGTSRACAVYSEANYNVYANLAVSDVTRDIAVVTVSLGSTVEIDRLGNIPDINSGGGNDTLIGSYVRNVFHAGDGKDTLRGMEGGDALYGEGGADHIYGDADGDRLDGGAGDDVLEGGANDDIYVVDSLGDVVTEGAGAGTDTVEAAVSSWRLGANVENLKLLNSVGFGYGNDLANTISGNGVYNYLSGGDGDDRLYGYGGGDRLIGGTGADKMYGGTGDDTYYVDNAGDAVQETYSVGNILYLGSGTDKVVSTISYTLGSGIENLQLAGTAAINGTGNSAANTIIGNSAANTIVGGGGADQLFGNGGADHLNSAGGGDKLDGGTGDDLYDVNTDDTIVEAASGGNDRAIIYNGGTFVLGAGVSVETLELWASASATGITGNEVGQKLVGNAAANKLNGGLGNDKLVGGAGADTFIFNTTLNKDANVDNIGDFAHGTDKLQLDHAIFAGLAAGALPDSAFKDTSTGAKVDGSDRILFNKDTGYLYFDRDGDHTTYGAVKFAHLDGGVALSASDFIVV